MKESFNTRFFQFFLALVITIVVSETVFTHVTKEAYAKESSDSHVIAVESSSEISQAAIESALGSPKAMPATTVAMKAAFDDETLQTETIRVETPHLVHPVQLTVAANTAKAANEELKAAEEAAAQEEAAQENTETAWETEATWTEPTSEDASQYETTWTESYQEPEQTETSYEEEPVEDTTPSSSAGSENTTTASSESASTKVQSTPEPAQETTSSSNGTLIGSFRLTAYCPCTQCCGANANGTTASGVPAVANHTIAADTSVLPFGTVVYIEGIGTFTVEDRGVYGNCIDIFFNTHSEACQFGLKYANVYILN